MADDPEAAGDPRECQQGEEQREGTFKTNLVQVSNVKKPLFFYVNLAERLLAQFETLEFSALGLAISTVVTVVEILKQNQVAVVTGIHTSTVDASEHSKEGAFKAKIRISVRRWPSPQGVQESKEG
mmetsp:Transcript_5694/g.14197  ORF Transcript_5694/g.14197 Transcript_5694/m.14197 type:complete len:126 (+) Transcript_5694:53-430(+)